METFVSKAETDQCIKMLALKILNKCLAQWLAGTLRGFLFNWRASSKMDKEKELGNAMETIEKEVELVEARSQITDLQLEVTFLQNQIRSQEVHKEMARVMYKEFTVLTNLRQNRIRAPALN